MVTYGDYFSRRVLHSCGVSSDAAMLKNDGASYDGAQRMDKIRSDMSDIYQTLYRGYSEKNTANSNGNFEELQVERKIVAAFYDSGVLSSAEREYFQAQSLTNTEERERICVEEAGIMAQAVKAQRIEAPVKAPLTRDVSK